MYLYLILLILLLNLIFYYTNLMNITWIKTLFSLIHIILFCNNFISL